ncbi:MAG: GNAT family N-acetyltransferase [Gammaproteobacteria bacterium]|nr:GNAT family N-acetyltransferase [Gammaproteobacteria bacterium]
MSKVTVRTATQDDLPELAMMFDAYRVFYAQPGDPGKARAFLEERFENRESIVLLAELDGGPAGFTQLYPMFSSVRCCRTWVLNDLFVAVHARRQGVADALLEAAENHARESGAGGLMLETQHSNKPAQVLYRKRGWQEETETTWFSFKT